MIVHYNQTGWDIVTQRAHGLLAAQLAMHWKIKDRPARWVETILAIAEHDDAEIELDGETLITPAGGPLNFSMKTFDPAHCRKLSMLSVSKSRYIALLTAMHMQFLYRGAARKNKEAAQFLREQKKSVLTLRKALGITASALEKIYSFMEWCDACSLLICGWKLQPEKRSIEISTGPDRRTYQLSQLDGESLTVDPWPFEPSDFQIRFESRTIKQLSFESSAAFRAKFIQAPVAEIVWTFQKQAPVKKRKKTSL